MTKTVYKYKNFYLPLFLFAILHQNSKSLFVLNSHKVPETSTDAPGVPIDQRRRSRLL